MTSVSQKNLRSTGHAEVLKFSPEKSSVKIRLVSAKLEEITLLDFLESCNNAGVDPSPALPDYLPAIRS